MASQEQLALLLQDDDDDDASSSSGSSSSNDNGSNDSSSESAADPAVEASSPLTKDGLPLPPVASSQPRVSASPPSMPAKKRIKMGFALDLEDQKPDKARLDHPSNSRVQAEVQPKEPVTPSHADQLSPEDAKPSPSWSSMPLKKKLHLPPHKAILERATTENTDSKDTLKTSGAEKDEQGEAASVAVREDEKSSELVLSPDDPSKVGCSPSVASATNNSKTRTRPSTPSMKPIRFPPMSSPGLLTSIPPTGAFRETVDPATGLATPAAVFAHAMSLAGYTLENRTKKPHRGSSVQRVVDDMFDSNVKFTLHFPTLVPEGLVDDEVSGKLMRAFRSSPLHSKKRRLPGFVEMAPKSLTIPYPEEFIQRRMEYNEKVTEREQRIVEYQDQELAMDKEREQLELAGKSVPDSCKPIVVIPPIPEPPSPPRIHGMHGFDPDAFEDNHPLYPPKAEGDQSLVSHLDKNCFHVVDGRYFGLSSNLIADPNFCGPNAPGLHGLSLSGGTGLATANTGGGTSSTLLTAPAQSGASVNANPSSKLNKDSKGVKKTTSGMKRKKGADTTSKAKNGATSKKHTSSQAAAKKKIAKPAVTPAKKKTNGPTPTATLYDLRKLLEAGGDEAGALRKCIIRSAVYASRCGKHSRSWRASDGKVYPDIGKAFITFANIKQCEKCKNANMDAYYCRLRRRHKEPDHDGGETFASWVSLFKVAMEELVVRAPEKTTSASGMCDGGKSTATTAAAFSAAPQSEANSTATAVGVEVAVERKESAAEGKSINGSATSHETPKSTDCDSASLSKEGTKS